MATKLNELSGMPKMSAAFIAWLSNISLVVITQDIVDGDVVDTADTVSFRGVIQPLSPEELELKPEGLRNFQWLQIHCFTGNLNLKNDDRIFYDEVRYKVMGIKDYKLDNYIEYHVIEDYETDG